MNILEEIASKKSKLIQIRERNKEFYSFSKAIQTKNEEGYLALISEIKPRSPSQGNLREVQNPVSLAKIMQNNGAAGISVLTEENYFGGSLQNLIKISQEITLPLLRKDFITSEVEIEESFGCNADVVLLIVALIKENTEKLYKKCIDIGLEALVEVHNEKELNIALGIGAEIIGINNRDLKTLKTDLKITEQLINLVPKDKIVISESGVKTKKDAEYIASLGANAILVGSTLMQAPNISDIINEFSGIPYHDKN